MDKINNRVVIIAGVFSTLLGVCVLLGWYTHNIALIQISSAFVPMQYNTALGFLLSGLGLMFLHLGFSRLLTFVGTLVLLIGSLTLIEYVFGFDLGVDQLLMEHYITTETSHPGRMAPNTALCFVLTSLTKTRYSFPYWDFKRINIWFGSRCLCRIFSGGRGYLWLGQTYPYGNSYRCRFHCYRYWVIYCGAIVRR
jgi:hypothetical protein